MGGYWFQPETAASAAFRRTSSGPGSSGKPWPRLTAFVSRARRDMVSKIVVSRDAKIGLKDERMSGATGSRSLWRLA